MGRDGEGFGTAEIRRLISPANCHAPWPMLGLARTVLDKEAKHRSVKDRK